MHTVHDPQRRLWHGLLALLSVLALVGSGAVSAWAHTIVSKVTTTPATTVGGVATYQITVGSAGQSIDSTFMRLVDTLPTGFTYRATQAIQFFNGARFTTATAPGYTGPFFPSFGDTSPAWGRFDNPGTTGANVVLTFDANVVNPVCTSSITNTAQVPNDAAPTTQHAVLIPAINQAPLIVTGPPAVLTVTKTTSTPVIINTGAPGMQAVYTFTVSNSTSKCAATGVNITDVLPPGFTYASTGAITFTGTPAAASRVGGTNPTVGATTPTWTGFLIPGGSSMTLTFTANIAATIANGTYFNSTNAIPAEGAAVVNNFGPGAPVVLAPVSVTKIFGSVNPASAQVNTPIPLTFTVTKLAGAALTSLSFTDTLPSGLVVSGTPATPQCGGGTVSGSGGVIAISGGSIAAAATSCTITVNVVSATQGSYLNDSSNFSGFVPPTLVTAGANATLNISNAVLTKAFLTPVVGVNGTSVLRFTLTNAPGGAADTGLGFTDTLPANVSVVPGFATSQCNGGTVSSSGPQNIRLSSGSLAAGATSCTVDVTVRGLVPGTYLNDSTNISGLTGGLTAATVSATLQVRGTILEKNFSPVSIGLNGTSTLTFVLTNGAGNPPQTGLAFTEVLPTNVTLSAVPASPQCGGTVTGTVGGNTIIFSGGSLSSGPNTCFVAATVTTAITGTYINDSTRITSTSTGLDSTGVNATLTAAGVVLTKQFADSPVNANTSIGLVFRFTNSPGNPAQSGLAFTDTFPPGVVLANSTATFSAGCSGTVTDLGGNPLSTDDTGIKLANGAVTAGTATCTLTINVKGTAGGTYINNNASNISGTSPNLGTGGVNATLQVNGATLQVSKTTSTPTVDIIGAATGLATYTITVQNTGFSNAGGVQVTDTLPSAFTYASTTAITLNGAATRTAVVDPAVGSPTPVFGTFTIPAGDSIAITFNATVPNSQANGTYNNSASVTSTTAGTFILNFNGATSTLDDVTVRRLADLTIAKAQVTANPVQRGQTGVQYTLAVSNIGGAAKLAGNTVTVTEAPPTGLTVTALAGPNWSCTLATLTCTRTDALASGASYDLITVTTTVALTASSTLVNSSTVAVAGQPEANTNNNTGAAPPTTVVSIPTLSKTFGINPVGVGQNSTLTFTITNSTNNPPQSGLGFTDTLPTNVVIATPVNLTNTCGGSVGASAGTGVITLASAALASGAASCTVSVDVTGTLPGSYLNSTANGNISGLTGGLSATGLAATLDVRGTTLTKAFSPTSIAPSQIAALTFTITNGAGNPAQGGLAFIETLPAGLTVFGPVTAAQCGGTVTNPENNTISFSGGRLALNATSCTLTVNVTGTALGTYFNTAARISGASAGLDTTGVNATLTIQAAAAVTGQVFVDATIGGASGDNDGILNGSERGLPNVPVVLVDCTASPSGPTLATARTDGAGQYVLTLPSTGLISGTTRLCVVETNLAGYLSTGASQQNSALGSTGPITYNRATDTISFIYISGTDYTGLNFGDVPVNTLAPDGQQDALPGSTVFYPHLFTAGASGTVTLTLSNIPTPALPGWNPVLYRDTNCNGILDGSEPQITGPLTVSAGAQLCLVIKEFVPNAAPLNAQNQITLTATFAYTNAAPSLTTIVSRTDLTIVGTPAASDLVLTKSTDKSTALPGEVLTYTLTYTNVGAQPINTLNVHDTTPAFTVFVSAACGAPLPPSLTGCTVSTQPTAGATGALQWTFTGTLAPGSTGTVSYQVRIE